MSQFEEESQMEKLMENPNLWHIHDNIFGHLNHNTVEICRKVCKSWNKSLKRTSYIMFLQEFGDRVIKYHGKKVSIVIHGWQKAVKKYGSRASIEDLQEIKDSLKEIIGEDGSCSDPVRQATKNVNLMEFILNTSCDLTDVLIDCFFNPIKEIIQLIIKSSKDLSIDLNARDDFGRTALHLACIRGTTEVIQLMISSSTDFDIDVNARTKVGDTVLHYACWFVRTEIVQFMIKNWKKFGIDIKAQDNEGITPLDLTKERMKISSRNHEQLENLTKLKEILENEYFKMDVTDQAA